MVLNMFEVNKDTRTTLLIVGWVEAGIVECIVFSHRKKSVKLILLKMFVWVYYDIQERSQSFFVLNRVLIDEFSVANSSSIDVLHCSYLCKSCVPSTCI